MSLKLTLLFSFCLYGGVATAAESQETQEYQKTKESALEIRKKEKSLLASIYRMTQNQRKLAQQKALKTEKQEGLQRDILDLQKNIDHVNVDIFKLKKSIMARIRNLNKINTPTIFQTIFGSQDVMEMDRNARIMYRISKADMEQLRTYRGLKNLLDQQQNELKDKLKQLEKNKKELEEKESAIKNSYLAQMDLLKNLSLKDKRLFQKMKSLREKASDLQADSALRDMTLPLEGGIFEHKGKLELPVHGVVTRKFGLLPLQHQKVRIYHRGWFVTAATGSPVSVVFGGKVVYRGLWEGRELLIVDHGDHFYSVYGNLDAVQARYGQRLEPRQVVGFTGSSRYFGDGMYFEMRNFSQAEDPKGWFSSASMNISLLKEQDL